MLSIRLGLMYNGAFDAQRYVKNGRLYYLRSSPYESAEDSGQSPTMPCNLSMRVWGSGSVSMREPAYVNLFKDRNIGQG